MARRVEIAGDLRIEFDFYRCPDFKVGREDGEALVIRATVSLSSRWNQRIQSGDLKGSRFVIECIGIGVPPEIKKNVIAFEFVGVAVFSVMEIDLLFIENFGRESDVFPIGILAEVFVHDDVLVAVIGVRLRRPRPDRRFKVRPFRACADSNI